MKYTGYGVQSKTLYDNSRYVAVDARTNPPGAWDAGQSVSSERPGILSLHFSASLDKTRKYQRCN